MENDGIIRQLIRRICLLAGLLLVLFPADARAEDVEKTVFYYLTDEMELSPAAACGIMGNIKAESGFQPNIVGMGGAYGLCQWTGARITRLRSFCSSQKLDSTSAAGQMAYLEYELKNYYPQVYSYVKSVSNDAAGAYAAGYYWCMHFEIPANRASASVYRGNLAKNTYWPQYGLGSFTLSAELEDGWVKLTWHNCSVTKLAVMRSTKKNGTYEEIDRVKTSAGSFTDKTIKKQKLYYYYVCPVKSGEAVEDQRSNRVSIISNRTIEDSACQITLSKTSFTYSGRAKKPKVTVTYDGSELTEGTDYTLTYKKNINAGKAAVIISGTGSYKGSVKKKYTIEKAEPVITAKNLKVRWTNKKVVPKITVKKQEDPVFHLKTVDKSVARGQGRKLKLNGSGVTVVNVLLEESDNYLAGTATFKLVVYPGVPGITRTKLTGKDLLVKWECEGNPDGYEITYTKKSRFSGSDKTLDIAASGKTKTVIRLSKVKKTTWRLRIRSYKVKENGKRLYSKWSEVKKISSGK